MKKARKAHGDKVILDDVTIMFYPGAKIAVNFAGQAAAAVEGYAGDMAKLTVAVDESKEAIGKGLLDALKALSGDTSIDTFTTKMVRSAETIGNAFGSVIDFLQLLNPNAAVKVNGKFVRKSGIRPQADARLGERDSLNTTKKIVKARKDELSIITASNKAKTEIDKLKDKFDLERISLTAALNAATDEETKLRIRAQLAILDNNEALAKKLNAELESSAASKLAAENARRLAEAAAQAAGALYALANRPNPLVTMSGELTARGRNQIAPDGGFIVPQGTTGGSNSSTTIINVPVNAGTIVSEGELTSLIADTVRVNLKYGNKLVPAGTIQ